MYSKGMALKMVVLALKKGKLIDKMKIASSKQIMYKVFNGKSLFLVFNCLLLTFSYIFIVCLMQPYQRVKKPGRKT